MEDFIALTVVLIVVGVMFVCAVLLAVVMLALMGVYGLMHVSARVYTRVTGRHWDDGSCSGCSAKSRPDLYTPCGACGAECGHGYCKPC